MARRGAREGTIRKRKDGRWEGRIQVQRAVGLPIRRSVYGDTRAEVQVKLRKAIADNENGIEVAPARQTVGAFLQRWLDEIAAPRLRPRTLEGYRHHVQRHLVPHLGHLRLQQLGPSHVQALINQLVKDGLSPRTIRYVRSVLRAALNQALKWNLVSRNAASLVDLPRARQHEFKVLDPGQAKALLLASKESRLEGLLSVALAVGLRIGEAMALQWDDVDWDTKTVRIRRALQRSGGKTTFVLPKSERSRRVVTLPDFAIDALRRHRATQGKERLLAGAGWEDLGLVFSTPIGTPLDYSNLRREFRRLLTMAALPPMRIHDLRHTCATLLLAQGVNPRVVMETLGHSQIGLTLGTYSHVLPEVHRDAATRMNTILAG